jgi:hypothetical protein
MNRLLASAATGALLMYFLDPQLGARRRIKAQRLLNRILDRRGSAPLEEPGDRPLFYEEPEPDWHRAPFPD